jgi:hypothetical protein
MDKISKHLLDIPNKLRSADWSDRIEFMFHNQFETWNMARNHYGQFESVEQRIVPFDGFQIILQHNPARARSTCANLSKQVIENRRCFLCAQHLPEEQKGYIVGEKYLLLVNPFPIFHRHLTISDFQHTPQNINGRITDMLLIASELRNYTVFYNGPKCGASAPDHFHFQAVPYGQMPIDSEFEHLKIEAERIVAKNGDVEITQIKNYLRNSIFIESHDAKYIDEAFGHLYHQLPMDAEWGEPMMNILANYSDGKFRLTVFPRKAQRPSCYFRNDEDRILVSPASVELGGIVVVPRETDFQRITKDDLQQIFAEVSDQNPIHPKE